MDCDVSDYLLHAKLEIKGTFIGLHPYNCFNDSHRVDLNVLQ